MPYPIVLTAIAAIFLLQASGSVPQDSVGGSLVFAFVLLVATLVMGLYEAWTMRRGVIGWIVNIVVSFLGSFFAAQLGGLVMVMLLSPFMQGTSLAAAGGPVLYVALAGVMAIALTGSWYALQLVNRWR